MQKLMLLSVLFFTACGQSEVLVTSVSNELKLPSDEVRDGSDSEANENPEPPVISEPKPKETPLPIYPSSPYKTTHAGVEMKIYPPATSNQSTKLALFLHGDTANGYFEEYYISLKNYARSRNWLFVAALSPNRDSWWHENAFAKNLDSALLALNKNQIFSFNDIKFSGVSGGSTFLSMQFIPQVGMRYSGTVAATCGGASSNLFKLNERSELAKKYKMHFIYGENDFLANPNGTYGNVIGAAVAQYLGFNFFVKETVLPNYSHCAFDVNKAILDVWKL